MRSNDIERSLNILMITVSVILILKIFAYFVTESAVVFADLSQSIIILGTISFASFAAKYSSQPSRQQQNPNDNAAFTLFARGFEGAMLSFAGIATFATATGKLFAKEDIAYTESGTILILLSALINIFAFAYLNKAYKRHPRKIDRRDIRIILISTIISVLVIFTLVLETIYQLPWIDQVGAILISIYNLWLGTKILLFSFYSLIDKGDPVVTRQLTEILSARCAANNIYFTDLKHAKTGEQHWVTLTLSFSEKVEIEEAHRIASDIEISIISALSNRAHIIIGMQSQNEKMALATA